MLSLKKKNEPSKEFIGPFYEKKYRELLKKDKKLAFAYLRRAALLLFPLKPELWDEYLKLKNEVLVKKRTRKNILSDIKDEMEGL